MEKRIYYFDEDDITYSLEFVCSELYDNLRGSSLKGEWLNLSENLREKYPLQDKKITVEKLAKICDRVFPPFNEVRYEFNHDRIAEDFFAFGNENLVIAGVIDIDNKIVIDLGISELHIIGVEKSLINKISQVIHDLGTSFDLILYNAIRKKIVDARELGEIQKHFETLK